MGRSIWLLLLLIFTAGMTRAQAPGQTTAPVQGCDEVRKEAARARRILQDWPNLVMADSFPASLTLIEALAGRPRHRCRFAFGQM